MKSSFLWELKQAQSKGYALPAFNFDNIEMLKGIIAGAEAEQAPVIIMATEGAVNYMGEDFTVALGKTALATAKVPLILHWDHGQHENQGRDLVRKGFTSLMLDLSRESIEENTRQTSNLVAFAHQRNVHVESEIGHVGGKEDDTDLDKNWFTTVADAVTFVQKTKVDALAISVGSTHGIYKKPYNLNYDLIKSIAQAIPETPLVLHGGSGIKAEDIRAAVKAGITKVNFGTDLKIAYREATKEFFVKNPNVYDFRKLGNFAIKRICSVVRAKIQACGASNQGVITT